MFCHKRNVDIDYSNINVLLNISSELPKHSPATKKLNPWINVKGQSSDGLLFSFMVSVE